MTRQGTVRSTLAERGHDLYETPREATLALIHHVLGVQYVRDMVFWEPCAGRGAIGRELAAAGATVIMQDLVAYDGADSGIETSVDFLLERAAPARCRHIVTNPPYKIADAVIRHGLELGCDVYVLLRLAFIEGARRSDLMDRHCVAVHAGVERLPTMHREGWGGPKLAMSAIPYAWFEFSPIGRFDAPIALHRISWRQS